MLAAPLVAHLPKGATLIATGVFSPFFVPLKVLLMAAVLLALPVVLYQVWVFVAPGLYSHEKKLVLPLIIFSTLLFFAGIAFCYFFVFDKMFSFIQSFAPKSITATPDIAAYLELRARMFLAFGLAFEVPIVVMLLVRMDMVTVEKLREFRGYFIVLAFVVAAVLTPPDVVLAAGAGGADVPALRGRHRRPRRYFVRHTQGAATKAADSAAALSAAAGSGSWRAAGGWRAGGFGRRPGVTVQLALVVARAAARSGVAVPGLSAGHGGQQLRHVADRSCRPPR